MTSAGFCVSFIYIQGRFVPKVYGNKRRLGSIGSGRPKCTALVRRMFQEKIGVVFPQMLHSDGKFSRV